MARASTKTPALREIESLPEADCMVGFAHPRHTPSLFGHEQAERELAETFQSGRMHHAWLVTGPQGIGKATFAYRFARFALSAAHHDGHTTPGSLEVSDNEATSQQVAALSHPGLLLIRKPYDIKSKRFATTIPVDQVRRLRSFLNHRSAEQSWRVVIVDQADDLNINAANALLKSLEEPPHRTVFLLITSEPGKLLNTIRSRCRRIDLAPLSPDQMHQAVAQAYQNADQPVTFTSDDDQWMQLVKLSSGSVRRLLDLSGSGGLDLHLSITKLVAELPRLDWVAVHDLADKLQPIAAKERFELFYDLLSAHVAQLIRAGAGIGENAQTRQTATQVIPEGQLASWAALWETVSRDKAETAALNLDRKTFILETFSRLQAASSTSTART